MTARSSIVLAFLLVAAAVCHGQASAYSSIKDGNSLAEFCKESPKRTSTQWLQYGMCAGYITGIADAEGTTVISLKAAKMDDRRDLKFCVDQRATNGQLIAVVNKFLEDHPDLLHLSASLIVQGALAHSFPCKLGD